MTAAKLFDRSWYPQAFLPLAPGFERVVWRGPRAAGGIDAPLRWRKPAVTRVEGDLFHESIPDESIDRVFAVMALATKHSFQVLTERTERMQVYFADMADRSVALSEVDLVRAAQYRCDCDDDESKPQSWHDETARFEEGLGAIASMWDGVPLPNVWVGSSIEELREYLSAKELA